MIEVPSQKEKQKLLLLLPILLLPSSFGFVLGREEGKEQLVPLAYLLLLIPSWPEDKLHSNHKTFYKNKQQQKNNSSKTKEKREEEGSVVKNGLEQRRC